MVLSGVRQERLYLAVQALSAEHSVKSLCEKLKLNRSSYYKWIHREKSPRELENTAIVHELAVLYAEHNGTYGYRRLADEYNQRNGTAYNDNSRATKPLPPPLRIIFISTTTGADSAGWINWLRQTTAACSLQLLKKLDSVSEVQ